MPICSFSANLRHAQQTLDGLTDALHHQDRATARAMWPAIETGWAWALASAGHPLIDPLISGYTTAILALDLGEALPLPTMLARLHLARQVAQAQGEHNLSWLIWSHLGSLALRNSDWAEALHCHQRAYRVAQDAAQQVESLGNQGVVLHRQGQVLRAMVRYEQTLRRYRDLGDPQGEAQTLRNLGLAALDRGRDRQALRWYQQALHLNRRQGDVLQAGRTLAQIGLAATQLGDMALAIRATTEALVILEQAGDPATLALVQWNLGELFAHQGDFERAAPLLRACVEYEQSTGHPDAEADAVAMARLLHR